MSTPMTEFASIPALHLVDVSGGSPVVRPPMHPGKSDCHFDWAEVGLAAGGAAAGSAKGGGWPGALIGAASGGLTDLGIQIRKGACSPKHKK